MEAAMGARLLGEVDGMSLEEVSESYSHDGLRLHFRVGVPPRDAEAGLQISDVNPKSALAQIQRHTFIATIVVVLDDLRIATNNSTKTPLKATHMPDLDDVAARHFRPTQAPALTVSGRHLPLIRTLASLLVSPPHHYALLIIDLDGRFDATRLTCTDSDARHIYIHRPPRPSNLGNEEDSGSTSADALRILVTEATNFMLYSPDADTSSARRWWGTVVLGGLGAGDVVAGWKGWLRVNREYVPGFNLGVSAEEALARRAARQTVVDGAGWTAESQWGGFNFTGP